MSTAWTLQTHTCGHFFLFDRNTVVDVPRNLDSLVARSMDDLCLRTTDLSINSPRRCKKCQGVVELDTLRSRAKSNVSEMKDLFYNGIKQLLTLGTRYHDLPFKLRAVFLNDSWCIAAHRQYAVPSASWADGALFSLYRKGLKLALEAEDLCDGNEKRVQKALAKLNEVYAIVGQINGIFDGLLEGVEFLEKAADRVEFQDRCSRNGLPSMDSMARTLARTRWEASIEKLIEEQVN